MVTRKLSVGHYGHPLLKGAKHWSFLLEIDNQRATTYQITGSTNTYEIKSPEDVVVARSSSFLGKVDVGQVETSQVDRFWQVLQSVPVKRGDLGWNCQNWIVEGLAALKSQGFEVEELSKDALAARLEKTL